MGGNDDLLGTGERRRRAGLLLHVTSLPGRFGIGDLGPDARRFVEMLAEAGQTVWQIMPLGPPGYGESPYAARSSFAGNPLLISPELLARDGFLEEKDLEGAPHFPGDRVDFETVAGWKLEILRRAFARSGGGRTESVLEDAGFWLEDYALFMALREEDPRPWYEWEPSLATRQEVALEAARERLAQEVAFRHFLQVRFLEQWQELHAHASSAGVLIFGDIPMFPALDSADVWANQHIFKLDERGRPEVVAGVPPDAFSETGQLWGNPVYRWDVLEAEDYRWWVDRFRWTLEQVDVVRVDHFRGFESHWEVPAGAETAVGGQWVPGPGRRFFDQLRREIGSLPVVMEDLGIITDEVRALGAELGFPGMKVLQFAFDSDAKNPYLPHNHPAASVVYTGTHDNDTTAGWYESLPARVKARVQEYLGCPSLDRPVDTFIRVAHASVAETVIVPLQDVLGLGSEARMNFPGKAEGNWGWRFRWEQVEKDRLRWLRNLAGTYGRLPEPGED